MVARTRTRTPQTSNTPTLTEPKPKPLTDFASGQNHVPQRCARKVSMWRPSRSARVDHVDSSRAASGKVLTPSCARGKGGLTPSEGVRPQFCKARCSLYHIIRLSMHDPCEEIVLDIILRQWTGFTVNPLHLPSSPMSWSDPKLFPCSFSVIALFW